MATKKVEMQRVIHKYKQETGKKEINMHDVAKFAVKIGWPLPKPVDLFELLSKEFSQAARDEYRKDKETGNQYRANHAFTVTHGKQQLTLWVDIDEAPRPHMVKALVQRREQTVGDVLQMHFDAEHWNNIHPKDEPIVVPTDYTEDVTWRVNAPKEKETA